MTKAAKVDIAKVTAEILAGRHDSELTDLLKAVRARVDAETALAYRWKITLDDDEWTEDEVTLGEVQVVEKITGLSWLQLSPLNSARQLAAYLFARFTRINGMSTEDAQARVDAMTVEELAGSVSQYVKAAAPKDSSETSTKP